MRRRNNSMKWSRLLSFIQIGAFTLVVVGLYGCAIPQSSIDLSGRLYELQREQVEALTDLVEAYEEIVEREEREILAPYIALEFQLESDLFRVRGMQAVAKDPDIDLASSDWANEPKVLIFKTVYKELSDQATMWQPWVNRARTYSQLLEGRTIDATTLADSNSVQRVVVEGLLVDKLEGQVFPRQQDWRKPLKDAFDDFKVGLNIQTDAQKVAEEVPKLLNRIEINSGFNRNESYVRTIPTDLVEIRGDAQELLRDITMKRQQLEIQLNEISEGLTSRLYALRGNAEEIARALDALNEGLRMGRESLFRPKNEIVAGIESIADNLEALDILKPQDTEALKERVDALSKRYDEFVNKYLP